MNLPAFTALAIAMLALAQGARAADQGAPAPRAPAAAEEPGDALHPPPVLESEPAVRRSGRVRLSLWIGLDNASIRKDSEGARGDRISWTDDLDASPVMIAPSISLEFKIRRQIFWTLGAAWSHRRSSGSAPAGGLSFDGIEIPPGAPADAASTRFLLDLGILAWGAVEEDRRLAFSMGARYLSLENVLDSSAARRARETTEAVFPYIEVRGEIDVLPKISLEGFARGSLFTIAHRELTTTDETVAQYVDPNGMPAGEETIAFERKRVLLTQVNAWLDVGVGGRLELAPNFSAFAAARFTYLEAERLEADLREDMEWRAFFLEFGIEARF